MKYAAVLLILSLGLRAQGADFLVQRDLASVPERDELAAVHLDGDMYRATRAQYPDIRVFDAAGEPVPYVLDTFHKTSTAWSDHVAEATIESLIPRNDNTIEVVLETPSGTDQPSWIEFRTPLRNYEKEVQISFWKDGAWQRVVNTATIYDYSRFMDVRRNRVLLAGVTPPGRYRVIISDVVDAETSAFIAFTQRLGGDEPDEETVRSVVRRRDFRIDAILFGYRTRHERQDVVVTDHAPLSILETAEEPDGDATQLILETGRRPLSALRFDIVEENVSRTVTVEAKGPSAQATQRWRHIATGRIRKLNFRDIREEDLEIDLPEMRTDRLRITIQHGDAPPLAVNQVVGVWPVRRLLFLARSGTQYSVAYGSADAAAPAYDTEALRRIINASQLLVRTFDLTEVSTPAGAPRQGLFLRVLNHRVTLIALALVAVGVLAWAMVKALRGIDTAES